MLIGKMLGSMILGPASQAGSYDLTFAGTNLTGIYTPGAGSPGSMGRMDITPVAAGASVSVTETDGIRTVDQVVAGLHGFDLTLSADVYSAGGGFVFVGTLTISMSGVTVFTGDFTSQELTVAGGVETIRATATNSLGLLPAQRIYGDASLSPDLIGGLPGGLDGVDGALVVPPLADATTCEMVITIRPGSPTQTTITVHFDMSSQQAGQSSAFVGANQECFSDSAFLMSNEFAMDATNHGVRVLPYTE